MEMARKLTIIWSTGIPAPASAGIEHFIPAPAPANALQEIPARSRPRQVSSNPGPGKI